MTKKLFNIQVKGADGKIYVVPVGAVNIEQAREMVIYKEGVHPSKVLFDQC
jgi:hypothetical protein